MLVRDGVYYALALVAGAFFCGYLLHPWIATPWLLLAAFCLYFFRDPERQIPDGQVCVSPADGRIVQIRQEADLRTRISVFLNIFNVHVNRAPIAGRIEWIEYSKGSFRMAHKEVASLDNESNTLVITDQQAGHSVELKQIAGLVARRIVCNKQEGDEVQKGERFGLIKFGSRVDVLLGPEWGIVVQCGDKVAGGSSVLATLR